MSMGNLKLFSEVKWKATDYKRYSFYSRMGMIRLA